MPETSGQAPFDRSRWPEYADRLSLSPAEHKRLAGWFMLRDAMADLPKDWARRVDISGGGWSLADISEADSPRVRAVVYPVNLSMTGLGFMHARELACGARVVIHFEKLVAGSISLSGVARRSLPITDSVWLIGLEWDGASRAALVRHLSPDGGASVAGASEPGEESAITEAAYRLMYAENRLGNWAAAVAGEG